VKHLKRGKGMRKCQDELKRGAIMTCRESGVAMKKGREKDLLRRGGRLWPLGEKGNHEGSVGIWKGKRKKGRTKKQSNLPAWNEAEGNCAPSSGEKRKLFKHWENKCEVGSLVQRKSCQGALLWPTGEFQ